MEKIVLKAEERSVIGKKVKVLRREGKLPAVVYGRHFDPLPILLDARDASLGLRNVTATTLIYLSIGKKEQAVLVRDHQINVLTQELIHIDFQAVSLTETVRSPIAINFIESDAMASSNLIVVKELAEIDAEGFPQDLPNSIDVDVTSLEEGQNIYVRDLEMPSNITIYNDPDDVVVIVTSAREAPVVEEMAEEEEVEGEEEE